MVSERKVVNMESNSEPLIEELTRMLCDTSKFLDARNLMSFAPPALQNWWKLRQYQEAKRIAEEEAAREKGNKDEQLAVANQIKELMSKLRKLKGE